MLPETYIPLLSALAGALIGSFGTVCTVLIQARKEERKHLRDLTFQTATKVWQEHMKIATEKGFAVSPIEIYIAHTKRLVEAAERGSLTVDTLKEAAAEKEELQAFISTLGRKSPTKKEN